MSDVILSVCFSFGAVQTGGSILEQNLTGFEFAGLQCHVFYLTPFFLVCILLC